MSRVSRAIGTTVAALAVTATLFTATACEQAQNAIDCVQFANDVSQDINDLGNVLENPAAASNALTDLQNAIDKAIGDLDSQDAKDAANKLQDAVISLKDRVTGGERLAADDLTPLVTGAGNVLAKCGS